MPATPSIAPVPDVARFVAYDLSDLLPEGDRIVIDRELHILTQVHTPEGMIVEQQHLTDNEFYLLLEVFASFPYYCAFENLLSVQTGRPVDKCNVELIRARAEGEWDFLMRPVRNLLSRSRIKLRSFGLDVRSIMDTGYILMRDNHLRRNST